MQKVHLEWFTSKYENQFHKNFIKNGVGWPKFSPTQIYYRNLVKQKILKYPCPKGACWTVVAIWWCMFPLLFETSPFCPYAKFSLFHEIDSVKIIIINLLKYPYPIGTTFERFEAVPINGGAFWKEIWGYALVITAGTFPKFWFDAYARYWYFKFLQKFLWTVYINVHIQ